MLEPRNITGANNSKCYVNIEIYCSPYPIRYNEITLAMQCLKLNQPIKTDKS